MGGRLGSIITPGTCIVGKSEFWYDVGKLLSSSHKEVLREELIQGRRELLGISIRRFTQDGIKSCRDEVFKQAIKW